MKEKILKFFKHDRTYNGAIKLYNEVGQRLSLKKQFNTYPESELKGIIFDELRELADISPAVFKSIMNNAVTPEPIAKEKTTSDQVNPVVIATNTDQVEKIAVFKKKAPKKGTKKASAKPVKRSIPAASKNPAFPKK